MHTFLIMILDLFYPGGQNTTIGRMTINPQLSMIERHEAALSEISKQIRYYNTKQTVINEEIFGPLQNDSVVIVVQVIRIELCTHFNLLSYLSMHVYMSSYA